MTLFHSAGYLVSEALVRALIVLWCYDLIGWSASASCAIHSPKPIPCVAATASRVASLLRCDGLIDWFESGAAENSAPRSKLHEGYIDFL